jgi:hypothetical protein
MTDTPPTNVPAAAAAAAAAVVVAVVEVAGAVGPADAVAAVETIRPLQGHLAAVASVQQSRAALAAAAAVVAAVEAAAAAVAAGTGRKSSIEGQKRNKQGQDQCPHNQIRRSRSNVPVIAESPDHTDGNNPFAGQTAGWTPAVGPVTQTVRT